MKIKLKTIIFAAIFLVGVVIVKKTEAQQQTFIGNDNFWTVDQLLSQFRLEIAEQVAQQLAKLYPNDKDTLRCFDDAHDVIRRQTLGNATTDNANWAVLWGDSRGRRPSGALLNYNQYWMGAPEECISIQVPEFDALLNKALTGLEPKFCRIDFVVVDSPAKSSLDQRSLSSLSIGACVPKRCSSQSIQLIYATIVQVLVSENATALHSLGGFLNSSLLIRKSEFRCVTGTWPSLDTGAIIGATIFSLIAAVVVASSLLDWFSSELGKKHPILLSFSLSRNVVQSLNLSTKNCPQLAHLNGLRVISLWWIMLYHSYNRIVPFPADNKLAYYALYSFDFFNQIIPQAFPSVDTFFLLSGLLISFTTLKKLSRENTFGLWLVPFYLHRYLRLWVPLASVVLFYTTLVPYLYNGIAYTFQEHDKACVKNWWATLLLVHNFVRRQEQCLDYTWYLAIDWQLYVVAPIFLIAFVWSDMLSFFLLGVGIAIHVLSNVLIGANNDISSSPLVQTMHQMLEGEAPSPWYVQLYITPWGRCAPFVVGLGLGFIIFKWTKFKTRLSKPIVVIGWVASVATGLAVIYGLYPLNVSFDSYPRELDLTYLALSKVAWSLCIAWVIFACSHGHGGLVDKFLSWSPFVFLAKLGYLCYLVHVIVIEFHAASYDRPFHLKNMDMAWLFIGNMSIAYAISYVCYVCIETPFAAVDQTFLPPFTKFCYQKAFRPRINKSNKKQEKSDEEAASSL